MVNIHANATDSSFTARIPNTQVMPSNGNKTSVAFSTVLKTNKHNHILRVHLRTSQLQHLLRHL